MPRRSSMSRWPRTLAGRVGCARRFRAPKLTPFYVPAPVPKGYSPSVPDGGLAVAGHTAVRFRDQLLGTALPYGKTRLWIQVGNRRFYFKLRKRGERKFHFKLRKRGERKFHFKLRKRKR